MDLNELKQLWRENKFSPKKNLGQNFLIDGNVREKILKNLLLTKKSVVVEIGPGF
ncbi:MAG: hypothetical protein KJ864_02660, partial [Candidatus Omnitrophica bacterium]|nr:hypothetical protein [Candidatus Omnitrophota bacterium]MBU1894705.1 hypothetical protein [Candidatus Omnitrophota bacterium]